MDAIEIIECIRRDRDLILGRLAARASDLQTYGYLQNTLPATDVSKDVEFQRRFNRFYKMRSKPPGWYQMFFGLLEREKLTRSSTFEKLIREIFNRWGEVHPSFASKLLATINPESPVYDKEVCRNLGIKPIVTTDPEVRLNGAITNFHAVQQFHSAANGTTAARELIDAFDAAFERFVSFTTVKKLDLMLWQWCRPAE